ncbi:site-specific DNA-methyltransferase [Francisella salimarina]|uniref:site-specific DNA-methyltransferase n=1 Tax=Francisella salimarina TaxID=2599927 RepID=UPI003D81BFFC
MNRNKLTNDYDPRAEKIQALKQLIPEAIQDGKINIEALRDFLQEEVQSYAEDDEPFTFTWPGKKKARQLAFTKSNKTLEPVAGEGLDEDKTRNLFIEGDNLEVLKALKKSYQGKVKMIYIDPPYNTGNDFVYKDNFSESEEDFLKRQGLIDEEGNRLVKNTKNSGRFHSAWLNMMYPRLILARDFLRDDGVIFISIDDNEQSNLKKLCDEIFGEENIKILAVKMSESSGLKMGAVIRNGSIPKLKEYVFVIKKSGGINNLHFDKVSKGKWDSEYNIFLSNFTKEDREEIKIIESKDNISDEDIRKLDLIAEKIQIDSVSAIIKKDNIDAKVKNDWLFENAWRICQSTTSASVLNLAREKKGYNQNDLFFVKSATGLLYFVKATFSDESKKPRLQLIFADDNLEIHPGDFWSHIKTTGLDNEGGVPYKNGKKPQVLLKSLIKANIGDDKNSIVFDFFAGSSSTAEAVMTLNHKEGYELKFIMNQLEEDLDETYRSVTGDDKKMLKN